MNHERPGKKRLSVDIPINLHDKVVNMAYENRCTVTKYVIAALIKKIKKESGLKKQQINLFEFAKLKVSNKDRKKLIHENFTQVFF